MNGSRHSTYFQLVETLNQGGCPMCLLAERSAEHALASLSYEQVNDPQVRAKLRAARGFCRRHAWRFLGLRGTIFGTAIIYADVLGAIRRELQQGPPASRSGGLLETLFSPASRTGAAGSTRQPAMIWQPHGGSSNGQF